MQIARPRGDHALIVLLTDRGSAYAAREVERYLDERQVVRLRSLPRTLQHNPWAERTNGELKARTGLGKGVRIESVERVADVLEVACATLNHRRASGAGRRRGWTGGRPWDTMSCLVAASTGCAARPWFAPWTASRTRALDGACGERRSSERWNVLD